MVTVSTLLYEGNYKYILDNSSWFLNYSPNYPHKKLIIVNNVNNREEITNKLEETKKQYFFDYFFVDDYEEMAKEYFKLDITKETTRGYYYQIPYYSLLMYVDTEYIFHVSDDCSKNFYVADDFILSSIDELEKNPSIFTTSLSWGRPNIENSFGYELGEYEELMAFKKRPNLSNDKFYHTEGFTDQVFFSKTSNLKSVNYNLYKINGSPCEWVDYCPRCWESRVCEYTYQIGSYRGIWKDSNYYYYSIKYD